MIVENVTLFNFGNVKLFNLFLRNALAHRPGLLLLDEPTLGVDAVSKKQIYTELLNAVQDEKRTVLISSHNLSDIERFADHVAIIHKGKILLQRETGELSENFRMIDYIVNGSILPQKIEGMYPVKKQANHYRALVDLRFDVTSHLNHYGAHVITTTPVSLEEMFVALVEE